MESGAKIRWQNGNILHPASSWKSPSKRRIPRLLVEHRAKEVGVLIYIDKGNVVFHETELTVGQINSENAVILEHYAKRYYLLPERVNRQDTFDWLEKPQNSLLFWSTNNKYYVKPAKSADFISF